jgi:hypothetical protein
MATGTFTQYDIGIRRNITTVAGTHLGERNFEPALATASPATVQYEAKINHLWWVDGTYYNAGTLLPYDSGGATTYSVNAKALLNFYFDQQWINPTS